MLGQKENINIAGIDFGSLYAGTTAVCVGSNHNNLQIFTSPKKQHADDFILSLVEKHQVKIVAIDAPLSLPAALLNSNLSGDYLYRNADKALNAMSPLFLGTYTARAIKLKDLLALQNVKVIETYPAAFIKHFGLNQWYNKKQKAINVELLNWLDNEYKLNYLLDSISNTHQLDAVFCWLSAWRFKHNNNLSFGNMSEGIIII